MGIISRSQSVSPPASPKVAQGELHFKTEFRESALAFIGGGDVPEEFTCPLSQDLMRDPVFLTGSDAGISYDRHMIEDWLKDRNTEPSTREVLTSKKLVCNRALKGRLDDFEAAVRALGGTLEGQPSRPKTPRQRRAVDSLEMATLFGSAGRPVAARLPMPSPAPAPAPAPAQAQLEAAQQARDAARAEAMEGGAVCAYALCGCLVGCAQMAVGLAAKCAVGIVCCPLACCVFICCGTDDV